MNKDDETALVDAATKARDQFAFYAREHTAAGKTEKAATNERFATMLTAAISLTDRREGVEHVPFVDGCNCPNDAANGHHELCAATRPPAPKDAVERAIDLCAQIAEECAAETEVAQLSNQLSKAHGAFCLAANTIRNRATEIARSAGAV